MRAVSVWLNRQLNGRNQVLGQRFQHWITITAGTLLDTTLTETPNRMLPTLTRHLSQLQPYLTSKGLLKLSHESYNPTTSALLSTLRQLLTNVKDKDEPSERRGAVYNIKLMLRLAGHLYWCMRPAGIWTSDWLNTNDKRATRNGDINIQIAEHHLKTNHRFDWDSAECVTYSTDYYQWITLESWFTNLDQTPLNRCQQLPAPYKRLIDDNNKTDK